jgi:3-oxoacyl-[acyl-carrier-protein] synthase-3
MPRFARVAGTGRYVPARRVENAAFSERFGAKVGPWLEQNVGIAARHYMADDEVTSDLALAAARQALERAGLGPEDVDLIALATDTPDQLSPATASVLQAKLGASRAGVFDLNCACAGWVTALDLASRVVATDREVDVALVVGAYGMSRFLDPDDRYTATLFADGAGAVVLTAGETPGFIAGAREAEGQHWDALGIFGGGTARPPNAANLAAYGPPRVEFARRLPSTFNLERWPALVRRVCAKADLAVEAVDLFLFTQLNLRTIESVMGTLGQPMSRTHWIMDRWGYTGSACIPMALDDAAQRGMIAPGDRVVLCASGGGVALAAAALRW